MTTSLDHLAAVQAEGSRLVEAVRQADLDAIVPGLEWDARTVAVHTGAVHRWAADIVRRRLPVNETGGSRAFWPTALSDADLADWLTEGLEALLGQLGTAPADLQCFTFGPPLDARTFWLRRQAHETAVHRADVEACGPGVTPFDPAFAQDGLHELVGGFALERGFASTSPGSLLLRASDGPSWRVAFGGERNLVTSGRPDELGASDATVTATSSELYLWAWNRPIDPEPLITGDPGVVRLWRDVRVT